MELAPDEYEDEDEDGDEEADDVNGIRIDDNDGSLLAAPLATEEIVSQLSKPRPDPPLAGLGR